MPSSPRTSTRSRAPEIEITAGEEEGDVEFDAVVQVRPVVNLTGYDSLQVELDFTPPDDESGRQAQVDGLRERFARPRRSRAIRSSTANYAEIDISGSVDGEPVDALHGHRLPLRGRLRDRSLPASTRSCGASGPATSSSTPTTLPERFGERAGEEVAFRVLVKDAKKKVLPDLTDEWVSEVTEFETLEALRDGHPRAHRDGRQAAGPDGTARARARRARRASCPSRRPSRSSSRTWSSGSTTSCTGSRPRASTIPQYLAATGQDQATFVDGIRAGSTKAVLADLGLRAVVAQEEIEATDEELDAEIDRLAERLGEKPDRVRRDLDQRGVLEAVRSDIARGKALRVPHRTRGSRRRGGQPDRSDPARGQRAEASDPADTGDSADSVPEEPQA